MICLHFLNVLFINFETIKFYFLNLSEGLNENFLLIELKENLKNFVN